MAKLPKTVFIHKQAEGTDDEYLECNTHPESIAAVGEIITVGVYELKGTAKVTTEVKVQET